MTDWDRIPGRSKGGSRFCPRWCVSGHGVHLGEEDWLHLGEPLTVAHGVLARLCMSVDPEGRVKDGPYVIVGTVEYTLPEVEALGASLVALARSGAEVTPP